MKVFFGMKYFGDNRYQYLAEAISKLLSNKGFHTMSTIENVENWGESKLSPRELMFKTFNLINQCDIVLIEASTKGVGLGIEAGYAFAKNKPVITIANHEMKISKTLEGVSTMTLYYKNIDDLSQFFDEMSIVITQKSKRQ